MIIWTALTVCQGPMQRTHTAEELKGTSYEIWGPLFWVRIMSASGLAFSLVGVLLSTGKKGSYFWLLGFMPSLANFGMYWKPSQHLPLLFGIGGTAILLSYFGILCFVNNPHPQFFQNLIMAYGFPDQD